MATHQFQTEVSQLLNLIIHSLYSHREIFLRELVSNASDALDKLKYLTVADAAYKGLAFEPRIEVGYDRAAGQLWVADNGVGMDEADLVDNLGTIARSGTKRFLEAMAADARGASNLIGQFGVGFYSAFMVADRIEVTTRKAGADKAWKWASDGKGSYSVEAAEKAWQGTEVRLFLNADGKEYADRYRLSGLVERYSNHIAFPIFLRYEDEKWDEKEKKMVPAGVKEEQANKASALWRRPKAELADKDYQDFYRSIAADEEEPLHWIHTKAEGALEYTTLFYIPKKAPLDLYYSDYRGGVKLYVKRVFISDDDRDLMPTYLRFLRGVIDSEDLPLNVSREILQQNRVLANIKSASVKKVLGELKDLATGNPAKYEDFIKEFNRPLKEGLYSDYANREALLELVRYKSSEKEGWTSLADYKGRMKEGQKAVYYISGGSFDVLRKSPLLEAYRKKGVEVLIMDDEIDELVAQAVGRYGDLELKPVNRADALEEFADKRDAAKDEELAPVVERVKKALEGRVKEVRLSARLTDSPACIVSEAGDPGFQLRGLFKAMGRDDVPEVLPVLELNPEHPLVARIKAEADDAYVADLSSVLLDQALLVEGMPLKDAADFSARLARLLAR